MKNQMALKLPIWAQRRDALHCPNKKCQRPLTWKPEKDTWAPVGEPCEVCKTPASVLQFYRRRQAQ